MGSGGSRLAGIAKIIQQRLVAQRTVALLFRSKNIPQQPRTETLAQNSADASTAIREEVVVTHDQPLSNEMTEERTTLPVRNRSSDP